LGLLFFCIFFCNFFDFGGGVKFEDKWWDLVLLKCMEIQFQIEKVLHNNWVIWKLKLLRAKCFLNFPWIFFCHFGGFQHGKFQKFQHHRLKFTLNKYPSCLKSVLFLRLWNVLVVKTLVPSWVKSIFCLDTLYTRKTLSLSFCSS